MQGRIYRSMPLLPIMQTTMGNRRFASYHWCNEMYSRRRGKYRSLGSYNYLGKDGDDFIILYGRPESQYSKTIARISPDDVMTLTNVFSGQGEQAFACDISGLLLYSDRDPRKSAHGWCLEFGHKQNESTMRLPYKEGMQVRAGVILNRETHVCRVRKINTEKAKPVREKLSEWKKIMDTMFALASEEWRGKRRWQITMEEYAMPALGDPVSGIVAKNLLMHAHDRTAEMGWFRDAGGQYKHGAHPNYKTNLIKNALEPIRDAWYAANGVYEWKDPA